MDAFFASVEQRDAPELRGKPVIVGGHPRRGVVLAASYEVRPFGVHSAMPMAVAMRRAPTAVVVPPRMAAYEAASDAIFAIMSTVTPLIEPLSLDKKLRQEVRLTGVSAQSLVVEGGQLSLFGSDRRTGRLNAALDRIQDKFGAAAVTTADLHATPHKPREKS
jgi:nucleotidyltransferase/DNA polymerase involved in DNA repair